MIETTIRDPEKLETLRADSQGRINLGVEYAGRTVEVVVAESDQGESDVTALQQTIGDRPMEEHERQGMLFIRLFGIDRSFLVEDHDVVIEENQVQPTTVSLSDVDWSKGYLLDRENVSRFEFDRDAEKQFAFTEHLTADPVAVTLDESSYDDPVYRFKNDNEGTSDVMKEYVAHVERIFGYDPTEELANVRMHPGEEPRPVLFQNPGSENYIAIAPQVPE